MLSLYLDLSTSRVLFSLSLFLSLCSVSLCHLHSFPSLLEGRVGEVGAEGYSHQLFWLKDPSERRKLLSLGICV